MARRPETIDPGITDKLVKEALRGCRFPDSRRLDLPLLRLKVVEEQFDAIESAQASRWDALALILADIVKHLRLQASRLNTTFPVSEPGEYGAPDQLVVRELTPNQRQILKQAFRATHLWCFAQPQLKDRDIGIVLDVSTSTVEKYRRLACKHISYALHNREVITLHKLMASAAHESSGDVLMEGKGTYDSQSKVGIAEAALRVLGSAVKGECDFPQFTPEEQRAIRSHKPESLDEYLLMRIAAWRLRPPYEQNFVDLALWLDHGTYPGIADAEEAGVLFGSLEEALIERSEHTLAVVGEPGSGKSTLLEHIEWVTACATFRGHSTTIPFLVSLDRIPQAIGSDDRHLYAWLKDQWSSRYEGISEFDSLISAGRFLLLFDGLNEVSYQDMTAYKNYVGHWQTCARTIVSSNPNNRLIFTCRTLDYTTPLSSQDLLVPRLEIRPLEEDAQKAYLASHVKGHVAPLWSRIRESDLADILRRPYYLRLFVDALGAGGEFPSGLAGVFASFVRAMLRKNINAGHPLLTPGNLVSRRDYVRLGRTQVGRMGHSTNEWELPEEGLLISSLDALAMELQSENPMNPAGGAGLAFARAIDVITPSSAHDILEAGMALGILDDDAWRNEVKFIHQQMQAYFVARTLAKSPRPDLTSSEWRSQSMSPALPSVLKTLHPAEALPPLSQTGWEEPTVLAVEMTGDPEQAIDALASHNLSLAGRCAAVPAVRRRLTVPFTQRLGEQLMARSRDRYADLRHRITCAHALGDLDDPRFILRDGPYGTYLLPPLISVEGGVYSIGEDEAIIVPEGKQTGHQPRHKVKIAPFEIGKFPITNAEFKHFLRNGYSEERWWDSEVARDWRRGIGVADARRFGVRDVIEYYRNNDAALEGILASGVTDENDLADLRMYHAMTEDDLQAELERRYPEELATEPLYWNNGRYNRPSQPVVGITWYEARAYGNWLSAQSGLPFRLPTEVEWEAAARGMSGRRYAYGDSYDVLACNAVELHLRVPSPIGVFPEGDTPEGISDMSGNVWEWTSSAWGENSQIPFFAYPYTTKDGREDHDTSGKLRRVVRGGSMLNTAPTTRTAFRGVTLPGLRAPQNGMRLAMDART